MSNNWVGINYFKIESEQMEAIFQACHKVKKLDFDNCSLKLENQMNFGDEEYEISKISMEDTFIKNAASRK